MPTAKTLATLRKFNIAIRGNPTLADDGDFLYGPVNAVTVQLPAASKPLLPKFWVAVIEPTSERREADNLISKTLEFAVLMFWVGSKWKMDGNQFV